MRIALAIAGGIVFAAGACFLVAAAALRLRLHFGPLTSEVVMGVVLLVIGGIMVSVMLVARSPRASAAESIPERIFENLSAVDLRGLALIFENRPLLASGLAIMLGLEKGLRKNARRP